MQDVFFGKLIFVLAGRCSLDDSQPVDRVILYIEGVLGVKFVGSGKFVLLWDEEG